jgi:hypothetical protein
MDVWAVCEYGLCTCNYKGPYNILICGPDKDLVIMAFDVLTGDYDRTDFFTKQCVYNKKNKEMGFIDYGSMKCKNKKICFKDKKAKIDLWAVIDTCYNNRPPCNPHGIFFVFKYTQDLSSAVKNFMENFNVADVPSLPPIVFLGVEPAPDDDSQVSLDNYKIPSKPNEIVTMKKFFAKRLKSEDGTIPDKFIFFYSNAMWCSSDIVWKIGDLLDKIMGE